jgi:hypothetical protein
MISAILFLDFDKQTLAERDTIRFRLNRLLPTKVINFFSSELDELAIISKHRVVSLPTYLLVDEKNKVKMRHLDIPSSDFISDAVHSITV